VDVLVDEEMLDDNEEPKCEGVESFNTYDLERNINICWAKNREEYWSKLWLWKT